MHRLTLKKTPSWQRNSIEAYQVSNKKSSNPYMFLDLISLLTAILLCTDLIYFSSCWTRVLDATLSVQLQAMNKLPYGN